MSFYVSLGQVKLGYVTLYRVISGYVRLGKVGQFISGYVCLCLVTSG